MYDLQNKDEGRRRRLSVNTSLKGLSHELDLAFDDMCG
jgi:hypothetical protein